MVINIYLFSPALALQQKGISSQVVGAPDQAGIQNDNATIYIS